MSRFESSRSRPRVGAAGDAVWAAGGLLVTMFVFAALITFSSRDWPNPHFFPHPFPPHNACGRVGAWTAYQCMRLVGAGSVPLLIFASVALYLRLARGTMSLPAQRAVAIAMLAVVASTTADVIDPDGAPNLPLGYGGVVGGLVGHLLRENVNGFGTFLILTYCALAALFFAFDGLGARVSGSARSASESLGGTLRRSAQRLVLTLGGLLSVRRQPVAAPAVVGGPAVAEPEIKSRTPRASRRITPKPEVAEEESVVEEISSLDLAGDPPDESDPLDNPATSGPSRLQGVKEIVFRHHRCDPPEKAASYPAMLDDWVLPPASLLRAPEYSHSIRQETLAREKARILEEALRDFRIDAPVVEIETGPVITMFEVRLAAGIKVSQIQALANDIARALKAPSVRVVAPIPGKSTVGIEVPRLDREKVRLRELITTTGSTAQKMTLPLYLGKDASGAAMVHDLAAMPHMLIAGTTGSGKSVCINSIVMSVVMTQRPDRVKLIMIDPKMVELSAFKEVPHLMCPIVTDMARAEEILEWACSKMDERYALLAEAGARNVQHYNRLTPEDLRARFNPASDQEAEQIPPQLPYIIIVIDELADLMMTSPKEVEFHLARLAQKSRAVGIHIVVATQRPEAKVVTGLIKSNLPCRCAFRVAGRMDSRIVLDQNGAEALLGQGDMLFLPPASSNLVRAQGTFIEDDELHAVVNDLRSKGRYEYHPELIKPRSGSQADLGERDELFEDAVRIILETQRGSVSLLQRRLTIGYSRASRLVDQMAEAGIVGEYKGSQAREVLMALEEWEALKRQVEQEMQQGYAADQDETPMLQAPASGTAMAAAGSKDRDRDLMELEPEGDDGELDGTLEEEDGHQDEEDSEQDSGEDEAD